MDFNSLRSSSLITAHEWEEKTIHKQEYKTKENFIEFLEAKCNMLESVSALDSTKKDNKRFSKKNKGVAHIAKEANLLGCPVYTKRSIKSTCVTCLRAYLSNQE